MKSEKVLIINKCPIFCTDLSLTLQGMAYKEIFLADSTDEALVLLSRQGGVDLLILDIRLPDIDSLKFLGDAAHAGLIWAVIISNNVPFDLIATIKHLGQMAGYELLNDLPNQFSSSELKKILSKYSRKSKSLPQLIFLEQPSYIDIEKCLIFSEEELIPYYQPKINLQTRDVVGVQVLPRLRHKELGMLDRCSFVDVVKHFGFMNAMTHKIVQCALAFLRDEELLENLTVSVFIEAEQLAGPELIKSVIELLKSERVQGQSLVFEIITSGSLKLTAVILENIVRLRLLGCGVSIDDFGTLLPSLLGTIKIPYTEIRVDAAFLRTIYQNQRSLTAVDGVIGLGKSLGVQVVAYGIETQMQLRLLIGLGFGIGQGSYFSNPLTGHELIDWLNIYKYSLGIAQDNSL